MHVTFVDTNLDYRFVLVSKKQYDIYLVLQLLLNTFSFISIEYYLNSYALTDIFETTLEIVFFFIFPNK